MVTADYDPERDLVRSPVALIGFAVAVLAVVAIAAAPTVGTDLPLTAYVTYLGAASSVAIAGLWTTDKRLREVSR